MINVLIFAALRRWVDALLTRSAPAALTRAWIAASCVACSPLTMGGWRRTSIWR